MTDNTNINLRLALDQQAIAESKAGIASISQQLLAAKAAAQSAGQSADASLAAIGSSAEDGAQSVNDLNSALAATSKTAQSLSSSGGGGINGLRRTGSALTQLGLGDIGRPVSLAGDIGQVTKEANQLVEALGPLAPVLSVVAGAVIGWQVGLKVLGVELEGVEATTKSAVAQLDAYYSAIEKGTTESIDTQLKALQAKNQAETVELNQLQAARDNAFKAQQNAFGGDFGARVLFGIGQAEGAFKSVDDRIQQLKDSTTATTGQIAGLTSALDSSSVAANNAAEAAKERTAANIKQEDAEVDAAIKRYQDLLKATEDAQIQSAEDTAKTQLAVNKEIATDTYAQARARLDAISQEQASNLQLIQNLKAIKDPTGAAAAEIAKLTEANKNLVNEGTQLLGSLNDLPTEIADRNKRIEDVQKQFNADSLAADTKAAQDRANIQQKLNDTLAADAQKLADTLAQDLTNLQNKQADNLTSLNRDQTAEQVDQADKTLTIQIDTQRKAVQLAQDHAAALRQIQQDAYAREFGLLLNRNFGGLLADRLQQTVDMNKENSSFSSKTNQLKQDEQNQLDDLSRSMAQQRAARIVAYNNANADAQTQYNREVKAAENARELADQRAQQARVDALNILNKQFTDEYNARYKNYVAQLTLQNKFGQDYLNAQNNIQNKLLQQANTALAAISSMSEMAHPGSYASAPSNAAHRALGGPLAAGQASWVNEKFNGTPFPPGLGLFIPAQAGNVSGGAGGSGGAGMTNNWYIRANDVAGVRNEVLNILEEMHS